MFQFTVLKIHGLKFKYQKIKYSFSNYTRRQILKSQPAHFKMSKKNKTFTEMITTTKILTANRILA